MSGLLPWLVPIVAAVPALVVVLTRRSRPLAVPLADAPAFRRAARRTALVRTVLALALIGLLAGCVATIRQPADPFDALVPKGSNTVVVLDVSASVSDLVYREIARTMTGLVETAGDDRRIGLVLFSDVAQEALPPGTPAAELRPFIRYFEPQERAERRQEAELLPERRPRRPAADAVSAESVVPKLQRRDAHLGRPRGRPRRAREGRLHRGPGSPPERSRRGRGRRCPAGRGARDLCP